MLLNRNIEKRSTDDLSKYTWKELWKRGYDVTYTKEQNYYTCLNILSNSIAKLPISIKKDTDKGEIEAKEHYMWDILKLRMNPNMNSFECIKSLILLYKHYGCSGLYINRDVRGKIEGLYPVKITKITVDDMGLIKSNKNNKVLVDFTCIGKDESCFDKDIIILKDNSFDGINTESTKKYIKTTIDTNVQAQNYQKDLFSNGLTSKAVIQLLSDIKDEKELRKTQEKFSRMYSNNGRIFTVPAGYQVTPLNLDLVSSQFAELKTMGKKDIANSIGVPFNLLENGYLKEEENISYLTNTLLPIIIQLEQEMNWKLLTDTDRKKGYRIKININSMLRTNAETQKNIICDYVKNGIYSLEYSRKLLGVYSDFDNETVTLPSGQVLLKDLINGNATWQKDNKSTGEGVG
ncbi:phage portal protein [Clostridium botulinum]|nr:phage portal protein [Clostridium botulinum]